MWPLYDFSIFEENIGRLESPPILGKPRLLAPYPEADRMSNEDTREHGQDAPDTAETSLLPSRRKLNGLYLHLCPICGTEHRVNEARHRVAYGRQLTCSCECEVQRRKKIRMKWRCI